MKRVYIYVAICLLGLWTIVWAQSPSTDIQTQLLELWVIPDKIAQQNIVSRYEYTRLLSTLDCSQCSPPTPILAQELQQRNKNRDPLQSNLDDIDLGNMYHQDQDMSYCVAHVASNGWMWWFPRGSSPLCPGKFCWANTLVFGDLAQSLYNYSAPKLLNSLSIERVSVAQRIESLGTQIDIYTARTTAQALDRCGDDACAPATLAEADIYARYCQYNLWACGMRSTDSLSENQYPIWHINLLHDRWIIDINDETLQTLSRYAPVPWDLLIEIYIPLITAAQCPILTDFDFDGIRNSQDLCPLVYDPQQRDLDSDAIGDVCDDDIDGDGISNAMWAVDDAWHIRLEKAWSHEDNCLFTPNSAQEDQDNNTTGDDCEWLAAWKPLQIEATPSSSSVGETIQAKAISTHEHIVRSRWDGSTSVWARSNHIYTDANTYTLIWRSYDPIDSYTYSPNHVHTTCPHVEDSICIVSVAKTSIYINNDGTLAAGLLWYSEPLTWIPWQEIALKHIRSGNISTIKWTIGSRQRETSPWEDLTHSFAGAGIYTVKVEWYALDNTRVWLSQFNIEIQEEQETQQTRTAYLQTSQLEYSLNDIIALETVYTWFDEQQVEKVTRSMWSDISKETDWLDTSLRLTTPWHVLIEQTIEFLDTYPDMTQFISIHVWTEQTSYESKLEASPTSLPHHNKVSANIVSAIPIDNIYSIDRNRWDGTNTTMNKENISLQNTHTYTSPGTYRLRATTTLDTNEWYIHEQHIYVTNNDLCALHQSWEQLLSCDMDNDGIPDMCDEDIDGDTIQNLLWILLWENEDCELSAEIVDPKRLQQQIDIAKNEINNPWSNPKKDNCFIEANTPQDDTDKDGIWDSCDTISGTETPEPEGNSGGSSATGGWNDAWSSSGNNSGNNWWDQDGDGTPDSSDWCIWVPGSQWWCPNITPPKTPGDTGPQKLEENKLRADTCTECPCPFVDYAAEVLPGDRVRAVLTDPGEERVYSISQPEIVRE